MAAFEKEVSKRKYYRYYVRDTVAPFEEDSTHEFKGHRNISEEEVPPWSIRGINERRTRQPVSKTLNAFLNTARGGTVYLGITDDGSVRGMKLIQYQKDHIMASIDDVFQRYNPPVEPHRYKVRFVPVVERNSSDEKIQKMIAFEKRSVANADPKMREKPHMIRTHSYCWCDYEQVAMVNCGILSPDYVVEVIIKPYNIEDSRNMFTVGKCFRVPPLHEDEQGKTNFRKQASVISYTMDEIASMTAVKVRDYYQKEKTRLEKERYQLLELKLKELKLLNDLHSKSGI